MAEENNVMEFNETEQENTSEVPATQPEIPEKKGLLAKWNGLKWYWKAGIIITGGTLIYIGGKKIFNKKVVDAKEVVDALEAVQPTKVVVPMDMTAPADAAVQGLVNELAKTAE